MLRASCRSVVGKLEQQLERIPIGAHCVSACTTLAGQVLHEEGFDEREQLARSCVTHSGGRASRRCCSNRVLASSRSCGVALR